MFSTSNSFSSSYYSCDFFHCGRRNQYYENGVAVCDKWDSGDDASGRRRSNTIYNIWNGGNNSGCLVNNSGTIQVH